jgi:hypothetical protein
MVMYLHRTGKNYFQKDQVWKDLVSLTMPPFNAHASLSRGYLMSLQTTDEDKLRIRLQKHRTNNSNHLTKNIESYLPNVSRGEFWGLVVSCLGSAVRAEGTGAPPDGK